VWVVFVLCSWFSVSRFSCFLVVDLSDVGIFIGISVVE